MKDFIGNYLGIGDKVVYIKNRHGSYLSLGTVVDLLSDNYGRDIVKIQGEHSKSTGNVLSCRVMVVK